jgi:hypothetical protein
MWRMSLLYKVELREGFIIQDATVDGASNEQRFDGRTQESGG